MSKNEIEKYEAWNRQTKEYEAWRRRVESGLPDISNRIFALRDAHYLGCGFHWGIERDLGRVIYEIMNHDAAPVCPGRDMAVKFLVTKTLVSHLFKRVHDAEMTSAKR